MADAPDRFCGNCGRELSTEDQFCPNCGRPVHQTATVPTPEADVPVPPSPMAGGDDAAAAQATPQESVRRGLSNPYNLGCLGIVAFLLFAVVVAAIIGGVRNNGGSVGNGGGGNGGGEVAEKPKQDHKEPQLVVSSPSGSPTVTKDSIEVKGKVTPANAKVAVNGQSVTPDKDGSFSTSYYLNDGENYIKITAVNGSEQAEASRVVTRKLSEKEMAARKAAEEKAKQKHKPQAPNSEHKPQAKPKPKPQYTVGQTAQVANVTWKVSDAFLTNQLNSSFRTHKRGRFVVIDFTFTNNRNEEVTLDPELHMILKDHEGREWLGGSANMTKPFPEKPKGMHWETYERLWWEHHKAEMEQLAGMREWLDRLEKMVG